LGQGTYAKVYLALNATTGEIMAVKQVELPSGPMEGPGPRSRMMIEALKMERKTLMDLNHVNIVQYLGYEESSKYLSMYVQCCFIV
jgi:serine/threonine protein kinase